ncbi:MAG TPA: polysaccharide deacetylase family protein [Candidatus Paceibacterota bacterium]
MAGRSGTDKAVSITLPKNTAGDARWEHAPVAVEAGATYTFSSWYKSNIATEVDIVYTKSNGALSYGFVVSAPSSLDTWKQLNATLSVPVGVTKATVYHLIKKKGALTVDDFSLAKSGGVTPPPIPAATLTFTASPTSITAGQQSTLTWQSANATSCTASGGWTGTKPISGNETVTPSQTSTYSLSCTGAGGTMSKQVTVTVTAVVPPPPPTADAFSEGMVTLSFDDAWVSQFTKGLPIVDAAGIKSTFYIISQPVKESWDDYMIPSNVVAIFGKGHEIAGHTVTHPHLPKLSQTAITRELKDSKTYLEGLIGAMVTAFAYPYGEYNNTVKSLTKSAGYATGRATDDGLNTPRLTATPCVVSVLPSRHLSQR